jgi:hypothetical protein
VIVYAIASKRSRLATDTFTHPRKESFRNVGLARYHFSGGLNLLTRERRRLTADHSDCDIIRRPPGKAHPGAYLRTVGVTPDHANGGGRAAR